MICGRPATRKGIELWENLQREPHGLSRTEQVANLAAAFFAPVRVVGELIGQRFYMPPPIEKTSILLPLQKSIIALKAKEQIKHQ